MDAFAGTGSRREELPPRNLPGLLRGDPDVTGFKKGSARLALEVDPPFDRYLFIDRSSAHVHELQLLGWLREGQGRPHAARKDLRGVAARGDSATGFRSCNCHHVFKIERRLPSGSHTKDPNLPLPEGQIEGNLSLFEGKIPTTPPPASARARAHRRGGA